MARKKKGKAKSKSARRKTMKKKSSKKVSRKAGSRKPKLLKGRGKGKKGRDKKGVFSFIKLDDARAIDEYLPGKTRAVVIGGGGFTGTELAGELAFALPKLAASHGHPAGNVRLILAEGASRLLSSAAPWFGKKAEKRLRKIGVEVMLESFITDVQDGRILLKGGREVLYSLLVWTAGVKANRLAENLAGFPLEKNKCVAVDKNLRARGHENIFVIGDLAYCVPPGASGPMPMTAQTAIEQGHHAANFLSKRLGKGDKIEFHPQISRFIVPLGGKYALAELGFMRISGFVPWLLKRFVALKYFASILPFGKAFVLWSRGLGVFMRND